LLCLNLNCSSSRIQPQLVQPNRVIITTRSFFFMRGTTRLLGDGEVNLNSSQPSPSSSSPNRRAFRGGPRSDAARPPRHTYPVPEPASRPPADLHARPLARRVNGLTAPAAATLVVVVYTSTCLPCPLLLSPIRPALQKPEKLPSPRKKSCHL